MRNKTPILEELYNKASLYGFIKVDYESKCNSIIIHASNGVATLNNFLYENDGYFMEGISIEKTLKNSYLGDLQLELIR